MFIPFKKATLLIPSSPDNLRDVKHLFIILTNPPTSEKQAKVLLVNVSTVYNNHVFDDACIIEAGEHTFIKRRSFIHYRYARIEEASMLIKKVKSGEFIDEAPQDILSYNLVDAKQLEEQPMYNRLDYT